MKTSEALQRATDAARMAEAHGMEVWQVARVNDGIDTRVFYGMAQYLVALGDCRDDLEYAIGVCEKQPVWPESVLYDKLSGKKYSLEDIRRVSFEHCTWTNPVLCYDKCGQKLPEKKYLPFPANARAAQAAGLRFEETGGCGYWNGPGTLGGFVFSRPIKSYRLSPSQPDNWLVIVKSLIYGGVVEFEILECGVWRPLDPTIYYLPAIRISQIRLKGMTA